MESAALLEAALRHHRAGDHKMARECYESILAGNPDNVDALHLLGVLDNQTGSSKSAIERISKAIERAPGFAEAHISLGNVYKSQGEWKAAGACFERAISEQPDSTGAHLNLGLVARQLGDLDRALASYDRALEIDPGFAQAHFNKANALYDADRIAEAVTSYRNALDRDPEFADVKPNMRTALQALGDDHLDAGRWAEAAATYLEALGMGANDAALHNNLANAFRNKGDAEAAIEHYGKALTLKPEYAAAHNNLGNVLEDIGEPERAVASYQHALDLDPDFIAALNNLGNALRAVDRTDAALDFYDRAIALDPDFLDAHFNKGHAHKELGNFAEAAACYERVLEIDPRHSGAHRHLTSMHTYDGGERDLTVMQALYSTDGLANAARAELAFALGKAYEDMADYGRAFDHFTTANELKRATFEYSIADDQDLFRRIKDVFTAEFLERHKAVGLTDPAPIFVLGMPRSGTSLVEQIIASHSGVHGAGELMFMTELAGDPEMAADMDGQGWHELGAAYMEKLRTRAPAAARITDKMPHNFVHLGLIALSLPAAKIIHCMRSPQDTCLSLFKTLFTDRLDFAFDLAELGAYYGLYADLMAHWRETLPGRFHELRYEDLIADQAGETRRLLDYLELPWEDACMAFHKSRRRVATASSVQVRQGIYTGSVAAWRRYEERLGPLLAALPKRAQ